MRREFIRQEHLRRKQLKLMEDMDAVLRPRPPAAKQKKQRPKSIHRDHVESPKTPVKGPPGSPRSGGVCTGTAAGRPTRRARGAPARPPRPASPGAAVTTVVTRGCCLSRSRSAERMWGPHPRCQHESPVAGHRGKLQSVPTVTLKLRENNLPLPFLANEML